MMLTWISSDSTLPLPMAMRSDDNLESDVMPFINTTTFPDLNWWVDC